MESPNGQQEEVWLPQAIWKRIDAIVQQEGQTENEVIEALLRESLALERES